MATKKMATKKMATEKRPSSKGSAAGKAGRPRRYWLFKSEPESYSWAQLVADGRTFWSGVRNYQARNLLRDEIRVDDGVLFYHSNAEPMAVVGVARVVADGYPDPTQFEPKSDYHDPDSDPRDPRWFVVDIAPVAATAAPVTRDRLKREPALAEMVLLQRGSRLSVQPVTAEEWRKVLQLGGVVEAW